jgi:hypothetical protein
MESLQGNGFRSCDQRIFKTQILYWVKGISSDDTKFYKEGACTRSDHIVQPVHRVKVNIN